MPNPTEKHWHRYWSRNESQRFSKISRSKERIIKVVGPYTARGGSALDAGCGSGFFSRYFLENGMKTAAVDYADSALEMTRIQTSGRCRIEKIDLVGESLSGILRESFDIVFTDGLFEHFAPAEQNQILKNFISVLKPEGVIITFVPNRWSPWELIRPFFMPGIEEKPFTPTGLAALHERNGLEVVQKGGVNTLPFNLSPESVAPLWGMLLYVICRARGKQDGCG